MKVVFSNILRVIIALIVFIAISTLTYWGFYNGFYSPEIDVSYEGGEYIVYEKATRNYQNSDSTMKSVFHELYDVNGIVITKGFAIYSNTTQNNDKQKALFVAGCIVESKDTTVVNSLNLKFEKQQLPVKKCVITNFPLKGKMSILFGGKKVYPKMDEYCDKNGYLISEPVIEIYDRITKRIHYRRVLIKK